VEEKELLAKQLQRLVKNRLSLVGLFIVALIVVAAALAPYIAPYDPIAQDYDALLLPPSPQHPMGTDDLGRDIFSRVVYGTRYALLIGVAVVALELVLGAFLGFIAGYFGKFLGSFIMRVVDMVLSIPTLVLALAIAGALGGGLLVLIIAISVAGWGEFARLVRGQVLYVKEFTYIEAARAIGARDWHIMFKHLVPNCLGPVIVYSTLYMPAAILWSAALSFLGLGAQPPTPEWGAIISDGRSFIASAWWISTFPGIAIMITTLGFNFVGDGLRDALDPKFERQL
jgi:peptide/nickel transport system permease protein